MRIDLVLRAPETRPRDSSTARSPAASNLRISPAPANRARPPISIRNVAIEYRWAENHYDAIPGFLAELIARRVAVIALPDSTPGAIAAKGMTSTIPVVFEIFGDPVQLGLVNGWNRPGGNVTGIVLGNAEIVPKRMALIRELVPALTTLGLLVNPTSSAAGDIKFGQEAAPKLGLQLHILNATTESEIATTIGDLARGERRARS
jgi:putative ABC transport system substrate-binding protein